jgi:hypothetical protein
MKKNGYIFFLALGLGLAGCQTPPPPLPAAKFQGIPAKNFTVTVTCSDPTTRFMGGITADGETDHLVGMNCGTYQTSGHEILCEFRKTDSAGRLTITISSEGKSLGSSTTDAKSGGVRADLFFVPPQERTSFTTF